MVVLLNNLGTEDISRPYIAMVAEKQAIVPCS